MGLIVDYEPIEAKVFYTIAFKLAGRGFNTGSLETAEETLRVARELQSRNIIPEIDRNLFFPRTKSGYQPHVEDPPSETVSIKRLEKIVKEGETLPVHQEPIVMSSYRC